MILSANKRKRLARESQDEREARLERTSAYQRERLAREFQDEPCYQLATQSLINFIKFIMIYVMVFRLEFHL